MAIREKTTVTLLASAHCPSHSMATISVRDLEFVIDEPIERGGTNAGPTPTDTVLAALIGCTNVIGHKCAKKLGIDIGQLTIKARCEFERRGVTLAEEIEVPFTKVILDISANGTATENELQQVSAEVAKFCPLAKLFSHAGTEIQQNWHSSSA